ncbi:hypothetical protein DRE_04432 [Drechslerella stenobrocha 248]|uniref:Uncharacterized protein n=1 Tax=Drechslerella stenobrocha 248 TaxID=1043628 RepID=W7HQ31_9PEZI|nr:hypothetical protein DRE_04432 [Drechslerella stenobrocha 248]
MIQKTCPNTTPSHYRDADSARKTVISHKDAIEFVRLKCLQNLLARFEEPSIAALIAQIKEMHRTNKLERWRVVHLAILFEHTTRARRAISRLSEVATPAVATFTTVGSASGGEGSVLEGIDKEMASMVAVLQLAALWDPNRYSWYVEDYKCSRFVQAIAKRVKVLGHT